MNYLSVLSPNIIVDSITQINESILKNYDIKAVLLDIDNTLSPNNSLKSFDGVDIWLNNIKNMGINIMIISNNNELRVKDFAKALNIDYYISNAKKPHRFGFNKAISMLNINRENILVIGDQIFTDILGANLVGMKSILVEPRDKNEPFYVKLKRCFELPLKAIFKFKYKKDWIKLR